MRVRCFARRLSLKRPCLPFASPHMSRVAPSCCRSPEFAEYARRLGRAADRLVAEEPLPSPGRVEEELASFRSRWASSLPPSQDAASLAAAASTRAALSARLELYPRGMAALTALRLSLGALSGPMC